MRDNEIKKAQEPEREREQAQKLKMLVFICSILIQMFDSCDNQGADYQILYMHRNDLVEFACVLTSFEIE